MNTQLRDPLDDHLRTLMRTAVADAMNPPTAADIERGPGLRVAPPSEPRHSVRWIAIAAVMLLALGGGVVWSMRVEHPANPADQPALVDNRPGLGAYLLPSTLPEGWRLVDISESYWAAENSGASPQEWLIEQHDGEARALLEVFPPPEPSTAATDAATATTAVLGQSSLVDGGRWGTNPFEQTGYLMWTERGQSVTMIVHGLDEAQARALRAELEPTSGPGPLAYKLADDSSFWISRSLGSSPPVETGSAVITIADADGNFGSIRLRATDRESDVLLDPTAVAGGPVAVHILAGLPTTNGSVDPASAEVFGIRRLQEVTATLDSTTSSNDPDEVRAVLEALAPVDRATWDNAIDQIGDSIETQRSIGSAETVAGILTVYEEAGLTSVCLRRGVDRGCRAADPWFEFNSGGKVTDLTASLLVGAQWIVVRGVNSQDAAGPIEVDVAGVESEIVSTDVGAFAVMIVPAGVDRITFSIGVKGQRLIADETVIRPIR